MALHLTDEENACNTEENNQKVIGCIQNWILEQDEKSKK